MTALFRCLILLALLLASVPARASDLSLMLLPPIGGGGSP